MSSLYAIMYIQNTHIRTHIRTRKELMYPFKVTAIYSQVYCYNQTLNLLVNTHVIIADNSIPTLEF